MSDPQSVQEEIDRLIEEWHDEFVVAIEAEKLLLRLNELAPARLDEWLQENAQRFLSAEIASILGDRRRAARSGAKPREFADAAASEEAMREFKAVSQFDADFVVAEGNVRRRVGAMTGSDHLYVAENYTATGRKALMLAAFHKAVAKKVGDQRTDEVFTEEQYADLFRFMQERKAAA